MLTIRHEANYPVTSPRLSLMKLAEYAAALPTDRDRIIASVQEDKHSLGYHYYDTARAVITDLLCGHMTAEQAKEQAAKLRLGSTQADTRQLGACMLNNGDAIDLFVDQCYRALDFAGDVTVACMRTHESLNIGGLEVDVHPDVVVSHHDGNTLKVGSIALRFGKSHAMPIASMGLVTSGLHRHADESLTGRASGEMCYVVDVFQGTVFQGGRKSDNLWTNLERAASDVIGAW